MSNIIEQSICEAVDILVDRAISKAGFDKTITAIIVECMDQVAGKYKVKYQDSFYYATSDNSSTTYNVNSEVYVLVPNGDFSKDKKILGTVKSLGVSYITTTEGDEAYEYIGNNVIAPHDIVELCSYNDTDIVILYDADSAEEQLLNIDIQSAEEYLKQSTHLIIGGSFKTKLPKEQQNYGNYGLIFRLKFLDDAYKEEIIRDYVVDVDNMIGQPYNLATFTRQIEEFEINSSQFQKIQSIIAFAEGFSKTDNTKPNDIFIKDIELNGGVQIDGASLNSYYLALLTPQGTFFPESSIDSAQLNLKAEVKIKGKVIDNSLHRTKFYWFLEHAGVNSKHPFFCPYGGQGWKCLNNYNIIAPVFDEETGKEISSGRVEWIPSIDSFVINKTDLLAQETKYKCVCVYDDSITLEKEILIKNYDAEYNISITSLNGTEFSYDKGSTTLVCEVDKPNDLGYNYYWVKKNNVGTYEQIVETTEENERYAQGNLMKANLENAFNSEKIYREQVANIERNDYENILSYLEENLKENYTYDELYNSVVNYLSDKTITRVEKETISNLLVKTITNFATYSCSVFKVLDEEGSEVQVGNASIKIINSFEQKPECTLIIHNGTQVFKYNEAGLSPAHEANENPIEIPTLSFTLFDESGNAIDEEVVRRSCKVKWTIPTKDTLLTSNIQDDNAIVEEGFTSYTNSLIFDYKISSSYNVNRPNNNIDLEVIYKDKVLKARTNLTFLKDGDAGTNGTDFVCKIVPNIKDNEIVPSYPIVAFSGDNMIMNYNIKGSGNTYGTDASKYTNWFKVQLWQLDEKVYEGISGNDTYKVSWEILKNKYGVDTGGTQITERSFINVSSNGSFSKSTPYNYSAHPADIVKATIIYEDKQYTATMPILVSYIADTNYKIELEDNTGFKSVLYSSDGVNPKFDGIHPFKIKLLWQSKDGAWIDISTSELKEVSYTWTPKGQVYNRSSKAWVDTNLITAYGIAEIGINEQKFQPGKVYDGQCVNVGIEVAAKVGTSTKARLHIPIHYLINKYGLSALNDWDGNSIEINEKGGMILSPQVGAGKKNNDNTFTGVLMGEVDDPNDIAGKHKIGLLGYSSGQRSIFLDAETGKAEFGVSGAGQIILDPSQKTAQIKSGNYSTSNKTGMLIDLTVPEIKFGSGNFSVNKEGKLTAKGGGQIAGWTIGDDKLYNTTTGMSSGGSYAFWAGNANASNAPFYVQHDGYIKASYGTIGGWSINSTDIYSGELTTDKTSPPASGTARLSKNLFKAKICSVEGEEWRFSIGNKFGVDKTGKLHCNSALIGGWNVDQDSFSTGTIVNSPTTPPDTNAVRLCKTTYASKINDTELSNLRFNIGSQFGVTSTGKMYSKDGVFEEAHINSLYINEQKVRFAWQQSEVVTGATLNLTTGTTSYCTFIGMPSISQFTIDGTTFYGFTSYPSMLSGLRWVTGGSIEIHKANKYFLTLTS